MAEAVEETKVAGTAATTVVSNSAKKIGLHPLAIASICDHYTRVNMGGTKFRPDDPVLGFLFGVQNGLDVSIIDATEAVYEVVDGNIVLNKAKTVEKRELWTKVFATHELLGWYTVGGTVAEPWCYTIQREMMELNEAPLFLLMNKAPDANSKQLPLMIFELEANSAAQIFASITFQLETTQVERIAVDQITKAVPTDGVSTLEVQNMTMITSLRTLEEKIGVLVEALQAIQQRGGQRETKDYEIIRRAAKICQQLPAIDSAKFNASFSNEVTDCMMLSFLGASTKTLSALTELSDIFNSVYHERMGSRSKHMR